MHVASIFILFFMMFMPMAFAQDDNAIQNAVYQKNSYSAVTKDPKLMQALDLMDGTTGEWAKMAILGDNLSGKPVKIMFKDLSKISPQYATFDALGWKDNDTLYIYINKKHSNAPPEALATILCHEAVHQDTSSSIEEETYCWGYEADVWIQMKKRNPALINISSSEYPLVNRLNTLEKMFKNVNYTTKEIKQSVSTNPGYSDLPMYSPGFGK